MAIERHHKSNPSLQILPPPLVGGRALRERYPHHGQARLYAARVPGPSMHARERRTPPDKEWDCIDSQSAACPTLIAPGSA
jgi:hypothetical protein